MCRYCKGTGKYRLLDRFVDCDQCDTAELRGAEESESADSLKFNFAATQPHDDEVPF